MVRYILSLLSFWILLCHSIVAQTGANDVLNQKIELSKQKTTIYQLLRQVSDRSGYLFIYDSQLIANDKKVKIAAGNYTLNDAIYRITGNNDLKFRVVGKHILLYAENKNQPIATKELSPQKSNESHFELRGTILDQLSNDVMPYVSVSVVNSSVGTISNMNGEFKLILPDSLLNTDIRFSHLGYRTQQIAASLLAGQSATLMLDPEVIPLQEIAVRLVNPLQTVRTMIEKREQNYSSQPSYLTTFYREGVKYRKKNIDMTEAVLKIYKSGFKNNINFDQVKLLKMQKVNDKKEVDKNVPKMRSVLNSVLMLDIVKNLPDFLKIDTNSPYEYTHTDITVIDDRLVNVISFEQNEMIKEPLYKGELYIDTENHALLEAKFEINPTYIKKATQMYVEKKNRDINVTPQKITYIVSYKETDGMYYISHIRGDLDFRVKAKKQFFSSQLHIWFEIVTCEIDNNDVVRFSRSDSLSKHNIFSNTQFVYDQNFWGNFNTIVPEEKLKEMIINYFSKNRD